MKISINPFGGFKVKRQKFGLGSAAVLLFIGYTFLSIGLTTYKSTQIDASWIRMDGRITDVSEKYYKGNRTYASIVEYKVNGMTYQVTSDSSSSTYPTIGAPSEIAYNPNRPSESKVIPSNGLKLLLLSFPIAGLGLLLLTPVLYIKSYKRSQSIQRLIHSGQKLNGVLVDIHPLGSNSKNQAYKIVVSATDMYGEVRNFESDKITGIAGLAMADFKDNPIPIDVYIDPANPENYYVDLSDIPSLTPERIKQLVQTAAQTYQQRNDQQPPTTV